MRLLTISAICFALLSCSLNAIAADEDFNGRWDLIVHNNSNCTVTFAWWLEVKGAGTPEVKATFVGFPDGSLHELPDLTIKDGVLHFAWDPPARTRRGRESAAPGGGAPIGAGSAPAAVQHRMEYEARYVNGKLEGRVTGAKNLTFTGEHAPAINEHDDGTWIKGKP